MSVKRIQRTATQTFGHFILPIFPNVTTAYGLPKTGYPLKTADGDDGDLKKGLPLTGPRFVDFEDGTIYDVVTGMMWVANPDLCGPPISIDGVAQEMNWEDAIDACEGLDYAGHNDWRMPNINELISLFFIMESGQQIDFNFFIVYNWYYWSSTTWCGVTTAAWITEWVYGLTYVTDKETSELLVIPVRGGRINA